MAIITIRGKLGSGAPEIGKQVAEKLQVHYIDREIISRIALQLNAVEQEIMIKETPPCTLKERISELLLKSFPNGPCLPGTYLPLSEIPLDDGRYVEALSSLIKNLACNSSAVIYGWGSQFILKDFPGTLHVSTLAPLPVRIKRIMKNLNLDEQIAKKEIFHFDNSARVFMKRYFRTDMEDPANYNLVIDTGCFDFEVSAQIIVEAFKSKFASQDGPP